MVSALKKTLKGNGREWLRVGWTSCSGKGVSEEVAFELNPEWQEGGSHAENCGKSICNEETEKVGRVQEGRCRDFPGGLAVKTSPSNAGGVGSIPGWGAKIPHASWPKNQNIKQKQYCNKFNKDLKKEKKKKEMWLSEA